MIDLDESSSALFLFISVNPVNLGLIPSCYCQRKIFSATAKLITHQASKMRTASQLPVMEAPSFITARKLSLSAVSGSPLMKGCRNSGKRADEKKVPESSHIGIITRF